MDTVIILIYILASYLIGSIPTAVLISKKYFGFDIREKGSGNSGATNTFRVLGKKWGIIVLLCDILKAVIPVVLTDVIFNNPSDLFDLAVGLAVVVGHIFPVVANFKGGKGIACFLGMLLAIFPIPALLSVITFLLVWYLSNYVSLGSIIGGGTLPLWLIINGKDNTINIIFSILVCLVVVVSHRKNIHRLINREENKTYLTSKRD